MGVVDIVDGVMAALDSINYGMPSSSDTNHLSLFKTSARGMRFIEDDEERLKSALQLWIDIIVRQILGTSDDISRDEFMKDAAVSDIEWLRDVCRVQLWLDQQDRAREVPM